MKDNKYVFEKMPVPKALATLAIPTIISQLISMIYNLADTYYIGQTGDPIKVASVSLVVVLIFLISAMANFFGIGGGSLIARLMGMKKQEEARSVCAVSIYGAVIFTGVFIAFCALFRSEILYILGSSEQTAVYTYDYVFWVIIIGGIPMALSITLSNIIRNEGFAGLAGFGLGFGGVLNIILDPIFMFVILPKGQEVTGAAVATMLSNICAALFFVIAFIYLRKKAILSISPKQAKHGLKFMGEIASVGFPSSIMTILASATVSVTNFLTASYGDIPLAAIGIVKKIEMLPLNIGMGLCQGMLPLVAYNYGAKDYKRMRAVIKWNLIYGVGFIIVCLCTFEFCAGPVVRLFISDAQTVALGETFLRILVLSTPFMFISFQTCYTFQAMGKGFESLVLSVCRQGAFNIPLLFFMNAVFGLYGIMWTQLIADMMSTAVALILYTRTMKKLHLTEGSSELASAHKHA